MENLRIGAGLETQVAERHLAAASELGGLSVPPDLGTGISAPALRRVLALLLGSIEEVSAVSAATAAVVREAATTIEETDALVGLGFQELAR